MKTDRIHIIFDGDDSVGIFPAKFEFREVRYGLQTIPLEFENEENLNEFMTDLSELVENHITGYPCYCITNEQYLDQLDEIP